MGTKVKLVLETKTKSLGSFSVRRVLPSHKQRMVGPFIFFDHMGPASMPPGHGIDVRPHPHIGLSTVTYLFEGSILHRDSLGYEQEITPGAVNWMTAGKGISHSERSPQGVMETGQNLHGIQTWAALPKPHEETEPAFVHHPASTIPDVTVDHVCIRLFAGSAFGVSSPVDYPHPIFYAACSTNDIGGAIDLPTDVEERCFYIVSGQAAFEGKTYTEGQMVILEQGAPSSLHIEPNSIVMLAGGAPMDAPRFIDWNFVSSTKDRLEQAKADWRASIAGNWIDTPFTMPPKENEYIPLPGDPEAE